TQTPLVIVIRGITGIAGQLPDNQPVENSLRTLAQEAVDLQSRLRQIVNAVFPAGLRYDGLAGAISTRVRSLELNDDIEIVVDIPFHSPDQRWLERSVSTSRPPRGGARVEALLPLPRGGESQTPVRSFGRSLSSKGRDVLDARIKAALLPLRGRNRCGEDLTAIETETLRLVVEGHTNKAIADIFGLSEKTTARR
ncbi:MAG: helix-turn-helix transcriptional regulator, partial [Pseudonocardiaceae bacterium]